MCVCVCVQSPPPDHRKAFSGLSESLKGAADGGAGGGIDMGAVAGLLYKCNVTCTSVKDLKGEASIATVRGSNKVCLAGIRGLRTARALAAVQFAINRGATSRLMPS